jgi:hypothetical protein
VDELSNFCDIGLEANTQFVGKITFSIVMKLEKMYFHVGHQCHANVAKLFLVSGITVAFITNNAKKSDEGFIEIALGSITVLKSPVQLISLLNFK